MSENEKKQIAQRLSVRVSTGLMFVEFEYLNRHHTPDTAWIRNIYILLSFYTELLLKAIFIVKGKFSDKADLEEKMKRMGHNLKNIGQQIGKDDLNKFGIKEINFTNPDYLVVTDDGNFRVEDFIDIRYDFIEGKVRSIPNNEHEMFRRQIKILEKANGVLKPLIY